MCEFGHCGGGTVFVDFEAMEQAYGGVWVDEEFLRGISKECQQAGGGIDLCRGADDDKKFWWSQ